MFLHAQKIINNVISESARPSLGNIENFFVSPENGKIFALKASRDRFVSFSNIKNFFPGEIIIFPGSLRPLSEEKEIERQNIFILGNRAVTEGGRILGEVRDFVFDNISGEIRQYYVKASLVQSALGGFKGELMIGREQVVALERKRIIVREGVVKEKKGLVFWQKKEETLPAGAPAT